MHWIDWLIMTLPLIICGFIAVYTRQYLRGVADFMAGGRGAGRFLICAARSEQGAGAAVFVASFQVFIQSGFTTRWWGQISTPVGLLLMVTGFVIYRYRQTRAMTLGQFFEMRYGRRFRLFAGILGFFAGLVNFGIIPAIGARFMVAFLNFPQTIQLCQIGGHALVLPTFVLLMGLFLSMCVIMTTTAGQVSVLCTDCAEGMFSQLFYTIIAIVLLFWLFDWHQTRMILLAGGPGQSMVNPFDTGKIEDFNLSYVLIGILSGNVYRSIAWQNSHAFNSSAATPHESRMGGILGSWRGFAAGTMVTLLSVCALTYFNTHRTEIDAALSYIKDPSVRDQMRSPMALTMMLPVGIKGMLLSICLMGIIAGDGIHLHSWGSIFIQDVWMPMRRKPLAPEQHIRLLRLSIIFVALWAFTFGWLVPPLKFVQYYWSITEAIFVGGAGIAILGGLYWNIGTNAGAWAGMLVGCAGAVVGLGASFYCENIQHHKLMIYLLHHEFYLSIPWITLWNLLSAIACYALVSKLTCRSPHNMDKLLHRGKYAVPSDAEPVDEPDRKYNWFYRMLTFGIDEQFSRTDRWITIGITAWSMFWFGLFAVMSVVYVVFHFSDQAWATYWLWSGIYLPLVIGVVTTIWFTIGCFIDMRVFFRRLREEVVDVHDDGSVKHEDEFIELEIPAALNQMPVYLPEERAPLTATE